MKEEIVTPAEGLDEKNETIEETSTESVADVVDEPKTGATTDYVQDAKPETDWQKRYSDSSREALKWKEEAEKTKAELENWNKFVGENPDVAQLLERQRNGESVNFTQQDSALLEKVNFIESKFQEQEIEKSNRIIEKFEEGKGITSKQREKMAPIVTALVKGDNPIPLERALKLAWIDINDPDTAKEAMTEGEMKAYAALKNNDEATYTTSNSTINAKGKTITLSPEEQKILDRMPGTPEEKAALLEYHTNKNR